MNAINVLSNDAAFIVQIFPAKEEEFDESAGSWSPAPVTGGFR